MIIGSRFPCLAYSSTLKMEATCFSEIRFTFNGLHGVISQKIELFITTAVRASDTAWLMIYLLYRMDTAVCYPHAGGGC
jgi:hypothetical protein